MRAETVARNYAEALFDLGEKSGNTDRYADLIDAVAAALSALGEVIFLEANEDFPEHLSGDAKRYLSRIRTSTQHMAQLIEDLLNLARVSRGTLERREFRLRPPRCSARHSVRASFPARTR